MKLICIDAGHGGQDPGATADKINEKDIALLIALKLENILLENGFDVFMTRKTDIFDTVSKKAKKANDQKADIFISIHCNASENKQAQGTETLSFDLDGESARLANCIQKKLTSILKTKDRGIKQRRDLCVLNSTDMPAVLTEIAFISNDDERELLKSDVFQQNTAYAIAHGIFDYFNVNQNNEISVENAKKIIKSKLNFDNNTMHFLDCYKYSNALFIRIAENLK